MAHPPFRIADERPEDASAVAALSALVFGPGRFARTAYRLREGAEPVPELCLTGWCGESLIGAIRFTPLRIGGSGGALLLGPLAIAPDATGQGLGRALIESGLSRARALGYRLVLLVGDTPYYARFGFSRVPPGQVTFPGPVDSNRILALELEAGAMSDYRGRVSA